MEVHHRVSPSIERRRRRVHTEVKRAMCQSLSLTSPRRVLDVGTGFGMSVQLLTKQFRNRARIWSVDPSRSVIREMRELSRHSGMSRQVSFKRARAEALPFPARRFDLVVSLLALHHLSNPVKGLPEMARVLAPKGKLIVADWRPLASPVVPHSARDIPPPTIALRVLKHLGFLTTIRRGRYWWKAQSEVEAIKAC